MPYTNINWVKIKLSLLSKKEFIEDLDDSQKLLFLGLLMLAGVTNNKVPNDVKYIKRMLNLGQKCQVISENLDKICPSFSYIKRSAHYIKFNKFNELHNYIRNAQGTPKDMPREEEIRIEKRRIDNIRNKYILLKNINTINVSNTFYSYTAKRIKELIQVAKGKDEVVIEGIEWMSKKPYTWTLETLLKKWHEFMAWYEQPDILKEFGKDEVKFRA